ncbi:hypothetical protein MSG28_001720 [Choristoneura fumiferana]|uniref:Uncharacterized protein n=1 Tax=Choristoneura fumiferana TaxID=7141 RepID=A0ACC0KV95_CHOFU|nr:hypothetical protein MSG28_001720 [Choristoneura fumiferana]
MSLNLFILCTLVSLASATVRLQELYAWNVLDWDYPDQYSRQQAIQSGALIPENALPVGIERWRNKLFVSVPRWKAGIPATLNYISLDAAYEPSPKLTPYPSWAGNELGNCDSGLNTVYRIKADKCDRLWVLDVGTYGYGKLIILFPTKITVQ